MTPDRDKSRHGAKTFVNESGVALRIRGAKSVTVHLAYCIGLQQPEMVSAITDAGVDISDWVRAHFPDLSPRMIAETLGLWRTSQTTWRFQDTAAFGHYGREI